MYLPYKIPPISVIDDVGSQHYRKARGRDRESKRTPKTAMHYESSAYEQEERIQTDHRNEHQNDD